jgi:hypothetical protein
VLQHQLVGHEHDVTGVQFMTQHRDRDRDDKSKSKQSRSGSGSGPDSDSGGEEGDKEVLVSVSRDGYMRRWDGCWSDVREEGGGNNATSSVCSTRYMPADRSSYTCLDSWQGGVLIGDDSDDEEEEECLLECCALGDMNGSVQVVDCEGRVVHSTAPAADTVD